MYISFCSYTAVKRMIEMMSKYVTKCAIRELSVFKGPRQPGASGADTALSSFWWGLRI